MDHYRVFMTRSADDDLKSISSYIRDELREPATAVKLVEKIKVSVMSLATFPLRHNLVVDEHLAAQGFRKIIIDNYIAFYIVSEKEQTVTVMRVLYGKRDWLHLL
jgi:toxin ParE1/3/4